jgi:hypothetical protein
LTVLLVLATVKSHASWRSLRSIPAARRVWKIFSIAGRRDSNVASVVHVPSRYAAKAGDGDRAVPSESVRRRTATM